MASTLLTVANGFLTWGLQGLQKGNSPFCGVKNKEREIWIIFHFEVILGELQKLEHSPFRDTFGFYYAQRLWVEATESFAISIEWANFEHAYVLIRDLQYFNIIPKSNIANYTYFSSNRLD